MSSFDTTSGTKYGSIMIRKKEGFNGQKAIVLPKNILKLCAGNPLTESLHVTDVGYYPKARFHYRERNIGIDQNILIYCVDGRGWAEINETNVTVEKGQYLIIPKNVPHRYGADDVTPWSIYWIHFKGSSSPVIVKALTNNSKGLFSGIASFGDKRLNLFYEIYDILELGYSADRLSYSSMVLWNYLGTFCYPELFNSEIKKDEPVEIVIRYMHENSGKPLKLKDMADLVHVSASHFSALFKKKTGYSPLDYFNHIKIQKACQYLEFTDIHIKELGYQLGFNDPFYFSRLFNKYMGESPIEYRKRKKYI